jgi:glutamate synthase (NADPH/NADH) small chain
MDVDTAVIAIGQTPNPLIQKTTEGLETTRWGTIVVQDETMATTKKGVYAGGDVVSGAATVISAMGAGKKAARSIHKYLMNKKGA